MLTQEQEEMLVRQLTDRIEALNVDILEMLGKRIKQVGTNNLDEMQKVRTAVFGGEDLRKLTQLLYKTTELNAQDIFAIFENSAELNLKYAKKFYDAKGIKYVPYLENKQLQEHVRGLATVTAREYINISRTSAIGYTIKDLQGNIMFQDVTRAYQEIIDKSLMTIWQGKTTFYNEMTKIMRQIGESGLKTIDYASGKSRRLDSAVRMNILDGMRSLNNTLQEQFGEEYGANGVEISVHLYSADDHAEVQGRQFTNEEFAKLQDTGIAKSYDGKEYNIHKGNFFRPISQYNCYHRPFRILLGVSKPLYSDEQLENIQKQNKEGFEFQGKHYTMYQGTQLQRLIEKKIRENKDTQILAKAGGNKELVLESQKNITELADTYKKLVATSKLPDYLSRRARVTGYRRVDVANMK